MRTIFITTQFIALHRWENAPAEVIYLRNYHRHIFHVRVDIEVFHDDREIEFIMFKHVVDDIIKNKVNHGNAGSCEMICDLIAKRVKDEYPNRYLVVEVSEDGENGARCEYAKEKQ